MLQVLCSARQLKEVDGNIVFIAGNGTTIPLTMGGSFAQPSLSPDGKLAVFLRNAGLVDDPIAPWPNAKTQKTEIWVADTAVPNSGHAVFTGGVRRDNREFFAFESPRFSPDDRYIYFLIREAVVTSGLVRLEIASGRVDYIVTALNFQVVSAGKYRGDLVVQRRKAKLASGFYEWYWLLTPDGKEVGIVGQDERDVALFMEQQE
jgi:hypothetical protein